MVAVNVKYMIPMDPVFLHLRHQGHSCRLKTPPVGILDVHLSVIVINSLKEAGGYEQNIPQVCISTTMSLQQMAGTFACIR